MLISANLRVSTVPACTCIYWRYCILQDGTPAAAAVREVGNYDHHHVALNQLEECRAANGVNLMMFLTISCRFLGDMFIKLFALWYQTYQSVCLSCLSGTLVYCGQTVGWIQMKFGVQVGLGPCHIVPDGDPASLPRKGDRAPQFLAHFYCGQMAGCIKMPLGTEVGLSPGNFVLDGDPAPSPRKGDRSPQFSAHVCCGQTAVWIKMPLGTEVCLGPGDTVLDGDPAPPHKKGHSPPPIFGRSVVGKRLYVSGYHLVLR